MFSAELIEKAVQGDTASQTIILKKMEKWFIRYITRVNYGGKGFTIEDLTQEGIIGVYESFKTFDPEKGAFKPYIIQAGLNKIRTLIFKQTNNKERLFVESISMDETITDDSDDTMHKIVPSLENTEKAFFIQEELRELNHFIMDNFTEKEKTIFFLRLKELSYEQIAQRTGQTKKWVDNGMQRLSKKLKAFRSENDYV